MESTETHQRGHSVCDFSRSSCVVVFFALVVQTLAFFSATRFGSPPYRWSCTNTTSSLSGAALALAVNINNATTTNKQEDDRSRDDLQDDGGFAKLRLQH